MHFLTLNKTARLLAEYSDNFRRFCVILKLIKYFTNSRLWVLDSGVIDDKQVCPAQLVVFELSQPGTPCSFIHKFHESLYRNMSLFITPVRKNDLEIYSHKLSIGFSNFHQFLRLSMPETVMTQWYI